MVIGQQYQHNHTIYQIGLISQITFGTVSEISRVGTISIISLVRMIIIVSSIRMMSMIGTWASVSQFRIFSTMWKL